MALVCLIEILQRIVVVFPQRVFSGKRHVKPGTKAVFFCYARTGPDTSGEWTETFLKWTPITELMPVWNNGLMSSRDDFVFAFDDQELLERLTDFANNGVAHARSHYGLRDVREKSLEQSHREVRKLRDLESHIIPCLYRPLDLRRLFYHDSLVRWPVYGLMHNMLNGNNLGIVTSRMTKGETFAHVMATRAPVEKIALSSKTSNNAYLFPLIVSSEGRRELFAEIQGAFALNLSKSLGEWLERMGDGLSVDASGRPGKTAIAWLGYTFAVLHSPSYRERYAEFLRGEFPRIPLARTRELFVHLSRLGEELVALHLMESPRLVNLIASYRGPKGPEVQKVTHANGTVWLDKKQTCGFAGVPEAVWNFPIGGYQVCEKWLKDRKGRRLSKDDIAHYQKIVSAISETIRVMKQIDETIEMHGGWPSAFITEPKT